MAFLNYKTQLIRDESNVSSIYKVTVRKHSATTELTQTYNDEDGNEQNYTYDGFTDDTVLDSRIINYNIPEADKTSVVPGHPHVHEEEIEYQECVTKWLNAVKQTSEYITAKEELLGE